MDGRGEARPCAGRAWPDRVGPALAWPGLARQGCFLRARMPALSPPVSRDWVVEMGGVRLGPAGVRRGGAGPGEPGHGPPRRGVARLYFTGMDARLISANQHYCWLAEMGRGQPWRGLARFGQGGLGSVGLGSVGSGVVRLGVARPGVAGQGLVRHGRAWRGQDAFHGHGCPPYSRRPANVLVCGNGARPGKVGRA